MWGRPLNSIQLQSGGTSVPTSLPPCSLYPAPAPNTYRRCWHASRRVAAGAQRSSSTQPTGPLVTTDTVTQSCFGDAEYKATAQGARRRAWAAGVRSATGGAAQENWAVDQLQPPLLLSAVSVVLVGPKKPISCGTVARSCSCFEVADLRIVAPRCQLTRSSHSVAKGGQWVLRRSRAFGGLADALADVDVSVAMTRWLPDRPNALPDIPSLLRHPTVQQLLQAPLAPDTPAVAVALGDAQQAQGAYAEHGKEARVALVFGREDQGLSDAELDACDMSCAISMGRLQETMNVSHAVTAVLVQLFQARVSAAQAATQQSPVAL